MRWRLSAACVLAALAVGAAGAPNGRASQPEPYDIILYGGRVLDGTGNPWYRADIGIRGGFIVEVRDLAGVPARRVVDISGHYVAPGFIDTHTHAGGALDEEERSGARPLLSQGITTIMANPDGGGPVDLRAQRGGLLEHGLGVNVGLMIGHAAVRREVLGMEDRAPGPDEFEAMKGLVLTAMEQGAFGLSSGPYYAPGSFAETSELIELARVSGRYGGVYQSHIRDEADYSIGLSAAAEEVIEIARESGARGIVTHIKALGPRVWGLSARVIMQIQQARDRGVEVFADQYPYHASSTSLGAALLPRWAEAGGREALEERLADEETAGRIRAEMVENLERRGGAERIQFTGGGPDREGRTLAEVADAVGGDPVDAAMRILARGSPSIVSFNMHRDDIAAFMRQPWTMTASDGSLPRFGVGQPHPRAYGTFPRKIRYYALEEGVVDLPSAIRSMTSLPAAVFRVPDRGLVRPGMAADLVVFDPDRIRDRATFEEPHRYAEGVVHVLVGGEFAVEEGVFTGGLHGTILVPAGRRGMEP
ncbi:MAG: amidohydrolase family protein [bacterium]